MPPRVKTINELEQELESKQRKVDQLQSRRDKLADELDAIDREIAKLTGTGRSRRGGRKTTKKTTRQRKKSTRGRKKTARRKGGRRRKRATGRPLVEYIKDVLKKQPKGMRVKEIQQAVKKAGYRSSSKDFYGIVAAALRDEDNFQRVSRGVYKLKG
jgi:hypothetical protein